MEKNKVIVDRDNRFFVLVLHLCVVDMVNHVRIFRVGGKLEDVKQRQRVAMPLYMVVKSNGGHLVPFSRLPNIKAMEILVSCPEHYNSELHAVDVGHRLPYNSIVKDVFVFA